MRFVLSCLGALVPNGLSQRHFLIEYRDPRRHGDDKQLQLSSSNFIKVPILKTNHLESYASTHYHECDPVPIELSFPVLLTGITRSFVV